MYSPEPCMEAAKSNRFICRGPCAQSHFECGIRGLQLTTTERTAYFMDHEHDLENRSTLEVLQHHLQYCQTCDLEETLRDYSPESTLINLAGTFHGLDEIRAFFNESMTTCLPPESVYESIHQCVDGEMALTVWKAESPFCSIPFGTDTFIVKKGKIVQQTYAGILNPKVP